MEKKFQIAIAALLVALLTGSLVYYFNHSLNAARQDYDAKILKLQNEMGTKLDTLHSAIINLDANLSSQIGFI